MLHFSRQLGFRQLQLPFRRKQLLRNLQNLKPPQGQSETAFPEYKTTKMYNEKLELVDLDPAMKPPLPPAGEDFFPYPNLKKFTQISVVCLLSFWAYQLFAGKPRIQRVRNIEETT